MVRGLGGLQSGCGWQTVGLAAVADKQEIFVHCSDWPISRTAELGAAFIAKSDQSSEMNNLWDINPFRTIARAIRAKVGAGAFEAKRVL
jgi:hypothetical protein